MTTAEFLKLAFPALIERTGDPLAPILLQEAHKHVSLVAKMLVATCDSGVTRTYKEMLLQAWPDDSIDDICGSPEFIVALSAMISTSYEQYAVDTANGVREVKHGQ